MRIDKRKWKKYALISLVTLMLVSLCVACNWTPTDTTPDASTASQPVESTIPGDTTELPIATEDNPTVETPPDDEVSVELPSQTPTSTPIETAPVETPAPEVTTSNSSQPVIIAPPEIDIPVYDGLGAYVIINDNVPYFTEQESTTTAFEFYSELDALGRCGYTYANVCQEIMPTEARGSIGQIKPTGWQTITYDIVDGRYLYNRCHLVGFQLSAENARRENLITGTRYLNVRGMLPFENLVADYVKETNNHVLYRVTPLFDNENLVAAGVLMEAFSVEDSGEGICFNVFCYNIQPGITINYATGESSLEIAPSPDTPVGTTYILNINTHKFHYPSCSSVGRMSNANKQEYTGSRDEIIAQGYSPCANCNP